MVTIIYCVFFGSPADFACDFLWGSYGSMYANSRAVRPVRPTGRASLNGALVSGAPLAHRKVRIQLLGPIQGITYAGHNLVPRGRKARAILGYLCFSRGKPIARTKLATLLWDDVPESQA